MFIVNNIYLSDCRAQRPLSVMTEILMCEKFYKHMHPGTNQFIMDAASERSPILMAHNNNNNNNNNKSNNNNNNTNNNTNNNNNNNKCFI